MKKLIIIVLALLLSVVLLGCEDMVLVDYSEEEFEEDLQNGVDVEGVYVEIVVRDIAPASAFGHNLIAGERLNFVSPGNPGHKIGDTVVVRIEKVASIFGAFIITYK